MKQLVIYCALSHHYYLLNCDCYQPLAVILNELFATIGQVNRVNASTLCFDQLSSQPINLYQSIDQLHLIDHQLLLLI